MRDDATPDAASFPRGGVRRARAVDVAVVLATLALSSAHEFFDPTARPTGWTWVFDVVLVLPLLWRRRRPMWTFAAMAAVAFVQWATGVHAAGDLAMLVALYSVGAYEPRRRLVAAAAAVALAGVLLAALRWAPPGHELDGLVLLAGTVTAALVLGIYARTRRAFVSSALQRAATAERERDQQALLAAATERARISREMHDIVAHSLSVMIALSDGAAA